MDSLFTTIITDEQMLDIGRGEKTSQGVQPLVVQIIRVMPKHLVRAVDPMRIHIIFISNTD